MTLIVIGLILISLQTLAIIGNCYSYGWHSVNNLIGDLAYYAIGIIGLIVLTVGICNRKNSSTKQPAKTNVISTLSKKILAFLMSHTKLFTILFIISVALLMISLFSASICDNCLDDARYHYTLTKKQSTSSLNSFTVGCGLQSCNYCNGTKITLKNGDFYFDRFLYYNDLYDTKNFFESCANVFLILTILFVCMLIIIVISRAVIRYRFSQNKRTINKIYSTNPSEEEHKFCKYCGKKIDEDSIFCQSCGKKLL